MGSEKALQGTTKAREKVTPGGGAILRKGERRANSTRSEGVWRALESYACDPLHRDPRPGCAQGPGPPGADLPRWQNEVGRGRYSPEGEEGSPPGRRSWAFCSFGGGFNRKQAGGTSQSGPVGYGVDFRGFQPSLVHRRLRHNRRLSGAKGLL